MDVSHMLEQIIINNAQINDVVVDDVLIIFQEIRFSLGDTCVSFDRLRYLKSFLPKASITINFSYDRERSLFQNLIKNNPHIDHISVLPLEELDFQNYDLILCVSHDEFKLLSVLHNKYNKVDRADFHSAVFSFSKLIMAKSENSNHVFPPFPELVEYITVNTDSETRELYLTEEERRWGNSWLESMGIKSHESLYIILDSSSERYKLINLDVYFEFLRFLLAQHNVKLLVFDENEIGKQAFYAAWLGDSLVEKIIFSIGLPLRQDLSIIASTYTKMVFGPCTGLMHCASGIFNYYKKQGKCSATNTPHLITYTGEYPPNSPNASSWWRNSPLVDCLLLRQNDQKIELRVLNNLTVDEQRYYRQVPCSKYTTEMLIGFVGDKLNSN